MSIGKLFKDCFSALNGGNIRQTALEPDWDSCFAEKLSSLGAAGERSEGFLTATLPGKRENIFFVAISESVPSFGAAMLLEMIAVLRKESSSPALPEYTLCFFYAAEETSFERWAATHQEKIKEVSGVLQLHFTDSASTILLKRSLHAVPSFYPFIAEELFQLTKEHTASSCELQDVPPLSAFALPWMTLQIPGKAPSAVVLKGVAAFALALAKSAPENLFTAPQFCEKYEELCRRKALEALNLKDSDFPLRMLRGVRLAAWRDLALKTAAGFISDKGTFKELSRNCSAHINAALQLLCGVDVPPFKSEGFREIPAPAVKGIAPGTPLYEAGAKEFFPYFDGRKTLFEAAKAVWADRPFPEHESLEDFDKLLDRCGEFAGKAEAAKAISYKEEALLTIEELKKALTGLGIVPGDRIMVHSSYKSFGKVEKGPHGIIQALLETVTSEGIVAMPALSDCCDGGTAGVYDKATTPIEKWVGIIPELFRQTPGVKRSNHPTHSVCAWGGEAEAFLEQQAPFDCFAPDGPWGKLAQKGKILFLGEAVGGNTFIHACETWYNTYIDSIEAEVNGKLVHISHYPGGCRGEWYSKGRNAPYFLRLRKRGLVKETRAGKAIITTLEAPATAAAMKEIFEEDPAILLHKSGCRECARIRSQIK